MNKRRSYTVAFGLALIACASLVAYPRIRNVIHNASKTSSQAPASSQNQSVSIHANGEGWPWIILQDGRELPTEYAVGANLDRTLLSKSAQPTALAAADFDGDAAGRWGRMPASRQDVSCQKANQGRGKTAAALVW